jgi:hypothetical protein
VHRHAGGLVALGVSRTGSDTRRLNGRWLTYALKAVDWEERLGLGMETSRGNDWHAGDGGLLARFSDGTVTDST